MSGPADFIDLPAAVRREHLAVAISQCHAYHFERNVAYRATVSARGVGPVLRPGELARILRPVGHFTTIEFADLRQEMDATADRWASGM